MNMQQFQFNSSYLRDIGTKCQKLRPKADTIEKEPKVE
jgi:hypothetical protein